jgi:hypothetical protein
MRLYKQHFFRLTLLVLVYGLLIYCLSKAWNHLLFSVDFTEYWSASRLVLAGKNPYSADLLWSVESLVAGWPYHQPVMMYNPPWILGFILPLGLLPNVIGRFFWLILSTTALIITSNLCWRIYGGAEKKWWIASLIGISFVPGLICLKVGQITPFVLLGIAGFLYGISRERWILAGVSIYLIALKPNLVFLFWPALLLWILKEKRWLVVGSAVTTGLAGLGAALIFNPRLLIQYLDADDAISPLLWQTPNLASGLRLIFGAEHYWLQFLPALLGLIWFAFYWKRYSHTWQWLERMPILLLVSFTLAFFSWSYDQILLIPALIQVSVWFMREPSRFYIPAALYWVANGLLGWMVITEIDPFLAFWFSPALLLIYLLAVYIKNGSAQRSLGKTKAAVLHESS